MPATRYCYCDTEPRKAVDMNHSGRTERQTDRASNRPLLSFSIACKGQCDLPNKMLYHLLTVILVHRLKLQTLTDAAEVIRRGD